jgi:ankyrin repeat protein
MRVATLAKSGCWRAAGVLFLVANVGAVGNEVRPVDAAKNRDSERLRALVKQRADVNAPQADGTTALHWAAHWNDLDATTLLIGAGANVNAAAEFGITPLILACTNGNTALVNALLQAGADSKIARESGETPLMTCSRTGNVETVTAVLARGSDVNAKEKVQGQTALMWAAAQNHADVARLLIERGADVNARTRNAGFTPILFAARQGAREAIDVLLAKGANINDLASDGTSVLMAATYTGHWDLAKSLLDRGADPNNSKAGYTALHWMSGTWDGHFTGIVGTDKFDWVGARGPGKLELVKALLAHGVNPNARLEKRPPLFGFGGGWFRANYVGATPFILAALGGQTAIMRTLLAAGADPLLTAKDGTTALMAAAGLGREHGESRVTNEESIEAAKIALEAGIPVSATNQSGQTALHGAAVFETDPVAELLLAKGANVNTRNAAGETPLTLAYGYDSGGGIRHSDSLAEILRKAGGIEDMQFPAVIKTLETACPTPSILVTVPSGTGASAEYGGNAARLVTYMSTQYSDGMCADLKPGTKVLVTATRLGARLDKNGQSWNGSLDATKIQIEPK